MKTIDKYRICARVSEKIEDTRAMAEAMILSQSGDNSLMLKQSLIGSLEDLPVVYIARIQVKVFCIWITIWSESCEASDGDSRTIILNRANKLYSLLAEK